MGLNSVVRCPLVRTGDAIVWAEGTGHCVVKESDGEDWGCNCVGCLKKEEESMFIRYCEAPDIFSRGLCDQVGHRTNICLYMYLMMFLLL